MTPGAAGFFSSDGFGPQFLIGLAVLGGLWSLVKGIPKVTKAIARVDTAARQIIGDDGHKGIAERIADVEKELKPNSGTSLRDAVGRVERLAEEAKRTAEAVAEKLERAETVNAEERATRAGEDRAIHAKVDVLMNALDQYAQERYAKDEYAQLREQAYIKALKAFGLDLTSVAEALHPEDT